jgi:hypothetical protein
MLLYNGFTVVLKVVQERFGRSITVTATHHITAMVHSCSPLGLALHFFSTITSTTPNLNPALV